MRDADGLASELAIHILGLTNGNYGLSVTASRRQRMDSHDRQRKVLICSLGINGHRHSVRWHQSRQACFRHAPGGPRGRKGSSPP